MTNDEIRAFLEEAIKDNPVMLFMKGTPDQPACGFSMRTSAALNSLGVKYAALAPPHEQPAPPVQGGGGDEQPASSPPLGIENRLG
jgi:hypothetical protein